MTKDIVKSLTQLIKAGGTAAGVVSFIGKMGLKPRPSLDGFVLIVAHLKSIC